ncbi:MAG: hypothetical protein WC444_06145 [Candidatus Paceibacterota bacterium]
MNVTSDVTLREQIANQSHTQWSKWMEYLFNESNQLEDGTVSIPPTKVSRWKRQIVTDYKDLTIEEQNSDLKEADIYIQIFNSYLHNSKETLDNAELVQSNSEMNESSEKPLNKEEKNAPTNCELMKPFTPMQMTNKQMNIEDINYYFNDKYSEKYMLFNQTNKGTHIFLHKGSRWNGSTVKIYNDNKEEITDRYPDIVYQAPELTDYSIIVEGIIENNGTLDSGTLNGTPKGTVNSGTQNETLNETLNGTLQLYDILYYDQPMNRSQLIERLRVLFMNIKDTENIKKNRPIPEKNIKHMIKLAKKMGTGIIRHLDSAYHINEHGNDKGFQLSDTSAASSTNTDTIYNNIHTIGNNTSTILKEISDKLPQTFISELSKAKDNWIPFTLSKHYRGHKEGNNIIMNSVHQDLRFNIPNSTNVQAITILTPGNNENQDLLTIGEAARNGKIRFLVKEPEPIQSTKPTYYQENNPGATTVPGFSIVVAEGQYTLLESTDTKLHIELNCIESSSSEGEHTVRKNKEVIDKALEAGIKVDEIDWSTLKDISGVWSLSEAHMTDTTILLMRLLNRGTARLLEKVDKTWMEQVKKGHIHKTGVNKEKLYKIALMSEEGYYRPEIAKEIGTNKDTVYRWQKALGYY